MADLRKLLADGLGRPGGEPDSIEALRRRIAARRRRRRQLMALGSAPIVGAIALSAVLLTGGAGPTTQVVASRGSRSTSTTTTASTTTLPGETSSSTQPGPTTSTTISAALAPAAPPTEFVGADQTNALEVYSVADASPRRQLLAWQPGGSYADLSLSQDGSWVYFSKGDGTCAAHVGRVPLSGGPEHAVTPDQSASFGGAAYLPALSPDDRHLAFVNDMSCDPNGSMSLYIQDLATGDRQMISTTSTNGGNGGFSSLAWTPDGRHLITGTGSGLEVLDLTVGVDGRYRVSFSHQVVAPDIGCQLASPGPIPHGVAEAFIETCSQSDSEKLVAINMAESGSASTILMSGPGTSLGAYSFDPSGRYLLYERVLRAVNSSPTGYSKPQTILYWEDLASRATTKVGDSSEITEPIW